MATIKLQGNASGSGSLTLTAPNTSSTRTITLPDEDGALRVLNTTYGAVGTYGLFYYSGHGQRDPGFTVAGTALYPANTMSPGGYAGYRNANGPSSGTWQLMGTLGYYNATYVLSRIDVSVSVWVRIA